MSNYARCKTNFKVIHKVVKYQERSNNHTNRTLILVIVVNTGQMHGTDFCFKENQEGMVCILTLVIQCRRNQTEKTIYSISDKYILTLVIEQDRVREREEKSRLSDLISIFFITGVLILSDLLHN